MNCREALNGWNDRLPMEVIGLVHKPVPMILPRFENSRNVEMTNLRPRKAENIVWSGV